MLVFNKSKHNPMDDSQCTLAEISAYTKVRYTPETDTFFTTAIIRSDGANIPASDTLGYYTVCAYTNCFAISMIENLFL